MRPDDDLIVSMWNEIPREEWKHQREPTMIETHRRNVFLDLEIRHYSLSMRLILDQTTSRSRTE